MTQPEDPDPLGSTTLVGDTLYAPVRMRTVFLR
jgi:hypothetical protein